MTYGCVLVDVVLILGTNLNCLMQFATAIMLIVLDMVDTFMRFIIDRLHVKVVTLIYLLNYEGIVIVFNVKYIKSLLNNLIMYNN